MTETFEGYAYAGNILRVHLQDGRTGGLPRKQQTSGVGYKNFQELVSPRPWCRPSIPAERLKNTR
jgi:hypothetical protein